MKDYIVKAIAGNGMIRAFAAYSKDTVTQTMKAHHSSRVVTAALGRLMTAGAMMGSMMKGEEDLITLRVDGNGPMKGMIVTANSKGGVKGYPYVADVRLPANSVGKLDVAGAVGIGVLSVTADLGLKEPYIGQVELATGEIAEDIAYYYAVSEQTNSSVGLGVSFDQKGEVAEAGGFIIQLMPFCTEEVITILERNLSNIHSVTQMFELGMTPENILEIILKDLSIEFTEYIDMMFYCNCSRQRVEKALISVGRKDLESIVEEAKPVELSCHFCNKKYEFSMEEVENLLEKI